MRARGLFHRIVAERFGKQYAGIARCSGSAVRMGTSFPGNRVRGLTFRSQIVRFLMSILRPPLGAGTLGWTSGRCQGLLNLGPLLSLFSVVLGSLLAETTS